MPIAFTCTGCAKRYEVSDTLAGKRGRCKQCGTEFQIPVPRTLTPPSTSPLSPTATASTPPPSPAPSPAFSMFDEDEVPLRAPFDSRFHDEDDDEDDHDDAFPPVAAMPRERTKKATASGGFDFKNPFVTIVGGGGAILFLFLAIVVWPSMRGGGGVAGAVDPNGNAAAVADAAGAEKVADSNGFPRLPPLPELLIPDDPRLPLGDISQHEAVARDTIRLIGRIADIISTIHDDSSARAAGQQLLALDQEFQANKARSRTLPNPSRRGLVELARRLVEPMRAVVGRLQVEAQRIAGIPNAGLGAARVNALVASFAQGLQLMEQEASARTLPYVEVFVANVPDQTSSDSLASKLMSLADGQATASQSAWGDSSGTSAFRIWPVANAQNFAGRIDFGTATVQGRKITIQADPEAVAALKVEHEEAESRRAAELAASQPPPDPQAPPGADEITKALVLLQSSSAPRKREGLTRLARVRPDESRIEEVVQAIEPFATSTDHFDAIEAVKALANWKNPEAVAILVHVIERSDDGFVRCEAEKQIGRLQEAAGAEAIASRINDDWPHSLNALRALGPAAEPAVIPLLRSADGRTRSLACEVLRDIGGPATLDTMKKLPADPDLGVRHAANQTMMAITNRVRSQSDNASTAAADQP